MSDRQHCTLLYIAATDSKHAFLQISKGLDVVWDQKYKTRTSCDFLEAQVFKNALDDLLGENNGGSATSHHDFHDLIMFIEFMCFCRCLD
jgi:hypothetical protein